MNDEFEFRNAQPGIQRFPAGAAIGRAKQAAIIAGVEYVRIGRIEGEMVLIGMDRISTGPRRYVAPGPTGRRPARTFVEFHRAPIQNVGIHRRNSETPDRKSTRLNS